MFLKVDSYAHKGFIYLIKKNCNTEILIKFKMAVFYSNIL